MPTSRTLGRIVHAIVVHLLSIGLIAMSPGVTIAFAANVPAAQRDAALADAERLREDLQAARDALPDTYLSSSDLALDLAFEAPETIVDWVRENVAYHPYRGVLRGPDGTLLARAGNAWDQALLTAMLLSDAGFETRVAYARLSEQDAESTLAYVARAAWPASDDAVLIPAGASGEEERVDVDARSRAFMSELETRSDAEAVWLRDALADAGLTIGAESAKADIVQDARDYAWVQYRLSEAEPWGSAHPVLAEELAWAATLEPTETFEGTVPERWQHRFRFRAVIERRRGETLETVPVMDAWERPVANLSGVVLSYAGLPDGYGTVGPTAPAEEAFEATTMVMPLFAGDLAPGGQLFDTMGNVVPPDAGGGAAAGVFQNVGGAFGDAAGALSDEDEVATLTAHWLEYTFVEPGGEESTHRRMIFDRVGPEAREQGGAGGDLVPMTDAEIYRAVQTEHRFMLAPGRYPTTYVRARSLDGALAGVDYLERLWTDLAEDGNAVPTPPEALVEEGAAGQFLRLYDAMDDATFLAAPDVVAYRPRPALVVTSVNRDETRGLVDIVRNDVRALSLASEEPAVAADVALRTGVWETRLEGHAFGSTTRSFGTFEYFEAVQEQGVGVRVLAPGDLDAMSTIALPEASMAAIRSDLVEGYAVVASEVRPEGVPTTAWWRVDPATGETLGRGGDGRGQDIVDYATLSGFANSVFFGFLGFGVCTAQNPENLGCCALDAAVGFNLGLILGVVYAQAFAAFAIGVSIDAGAFVLGATGNLPSFCSITSRPDQRPTLVRTLDPGGASACSTLFGRSGATLVTSAPVAKVVPIG